MNRLGYRAMLQGVLCLKLQINLHLVLLAQLALWLRLPRMPGLLGTVSRWFSIKQRVLLMGRLSRFHSLFWTHSSIQPMWVLIYIYIVPFLNSIIKDVMDNKESMENLLSSIAERLAIAIQSLELLCSEASSTAVFIEYAIRFQSYTWILCFLAEHSHQNQQNLRRWRLKVYCNASYSQRSTPKRLRVSSRRLKVLQYFSRQVRSRLTYQL